MSYQVVKPELPLEDGHWIFQADSESTITVAYRAAQDYGMIMRWARECENFYVIMKSLAVHVIPHQGDKNLWHYERLLNDGQ